MWSTWQISLPLGGAKFYADNVVLAIAITIVMLWNFLANRYWTFNDVE
jgi:putative flippase GtrA